MLDERNRKIALIHVAKKELGLSDTDYRLLLHSAAGIDSCKHLRSYRQYRSIITAFKELGFNWQFKAGGEEAHGYNNSKGASTRQLDYIYRLWGVVSRCKDDLSLDRFVERTTGVSHVAWISRKDASNVITALKKMQ